MINMEVNMLVNLWFELLAYFWDEKGSWML